jgi:hypothetical protein
MFLRAHVAREPRLNARRIAAIAYLVCAPVIAVG